MNINQSESWKIQDRVISFQEWIWVKGSFPCLHLVWGYLNTYLNFLLVHPYNIFLSFYFPSPKSSQILPTFLHIKLLCFLFLRKSRKFNGNRSIFNAFDILILNQEEIRNFNRFITSNESETIMKLFSTKKTQQIYVQINLLTNSTWRIP